ncbi:hypothetical protein AB0I50_31520 [Streptomyces prunicolor]
MPEYCRCAPAEAGVVADQLAVCLAELLGHVRQQVVGIPPAVREKVLQAGVLGELPAVLSAYRAE